MGISGPATPSLYLRSAERDQVRTLEACLTREVSESLFERPNPHFSGLSELSALPAPGGSAAGASASHGAVFSRSPPRLCSAWAADLSASSDWLGARRAKSLQGLYKGRYRCCPGGLVQTNRLHWWAGKSAPGRLECHWLETSSLCCLTRLLGFASGFLGIVSCSVEAHMPVMAGV